MKAIAIATLLATMLGGCVVVPLGYRHYGDGYYRGLGRDVRSTREYLPFARRPPGYRGNDLGHSY